MNTSGPSKYRVKIEAVKAASAAEAEAAVEAEVDKVARTDGTDTGPIGGSSIGGGGGDGERSENQVDGSCMRARTAVSSSSSVLFVNPIATAAGMSTVKLDRSLRMRSCFIARGSVRRRIDVDVG